VITATMLRLLARRSPALPLSPRLARPFDTHVARLVRPSVLAALKLPQERPPLLARLLSTGRGARGRSKRGGGGRGDLIAELKRNRCRTRLAEIEAALQPLRGSKDWNQLITAHAKVGNRKRAFGMLQEMRQAGVAPDVYSHNRLITVCEKGGQWQKALSLLDEMRAAGVAPNVISFNAAISACEKGGQWQKALSLMDEMRAAGVTPNVISFSAAIQACATAEQPAAALQTFDLAQCAVEPDHVTFNAVLDAVATYQPDKARALWRLAVERRLYDGFDKAGGTLLDLHDHSEGAAETAVRWWLEVRALAVDPPPEHLTIVTGWGKSRRASQDSDVRGRVECVLADMGVPTLPSDNPGRVVVDARKWSSLAHRWPRHRRSHCSMNE
jgi:pentatricopeptide repeat protein